MDVAGRGTDPLAMIRRPHRRTRSRPDEGAVQTEDIWPVFSDIALALVLFLTFALVAQFIELSQVFEEMKIKRQQQALRDALASDRFFGNLVSTGELHESSHASLQRFRFPGDIVFDTGSAELKQNGETILVNFAQFLAKNVAQGVKIEVEGHTDSQPISGGRFRDNWQLASERALTVVRLLQEVGQRTSGSNPFNPRNLSAIGYGEHRPLEDGLDSELNRRVEVRLDYSATE